jgi:hypothetical protein
MSFLKPKSQLPLPPPPPDQLSLDRLDRFGLPIVRPTLLSETVEERQARIATIERLTVDLYSLRICCRRESLSSQPPGPVVALTQ